MKIYKHKTTGIIGRTSEHDNFLHIARGNGGEEVALEKISMVFVENSQDWEVTKTIEPTEKLPTLWFKTEEIETWIGEPITTEGKEIEELNGGRGKLIVLHQCGENKEELISQLETMIHGLRDGFNMFAG